MLVLRTSVNEKSNATSIFVYDKTGVGTLGYGGSNPATTDFISSVLRIYFPDATTLLPQATYTEVDLYPTFPTGNTLTSFEITAASLNMTTFIDGWYIFKFIEATATTTYQTTIQKIFRANACCCVQSAKADVNLNCGCSENASLKKSNDLSAMMASVEYSVGCFKNRKAIEVLKAIQRICNSENCNGCR